ADPSKPKSSPQSVCQTEDSKMTHESTKGCSGGMYRVTRRSAMQMLASTTIAAPSIVASQDAVAEPAQKPLDIKSARPELRDAIWVLESAYEAAMEAGKAHLVAFDLYCEWEKKNPRPGAPRAYRKWERRSDRYSEEIAIDRAHEAWDTAL